MAYTYVLYTNTLQYVTRPVKIGHTYLHVKLVAFQVSRTFEVLMLRTYVTEISCSVETVDEQLESK